MKDEKRSMDVRSFHIVTAILFCVVIIAGLTYYYENGSYPLKVNVMVLTAVVGLILQPFALKKVIGLVKDEVRKTNGKPIRDMQSIQRAVPRGRHVVKYVEQVREGLLLLLWSHTSQERGFILVPSALLDNDSISPELGKSVKVAYNSDGSHAQILFMETEGYVVPEMEKAEKGDYTAQEDEPPVTEAQVTLQ